MLVDLKVVQLMSSRLCHDLVGPVGAVNNGLELMNEGRDQNQNEDGVALDLVQRSAKQTAARLAFFRAAFGAGKGSLNEARRLIEGLLDGGKVALDWSRTETADLNGEVSAGGLKLFLNMILLGVDALPRGGTLGVDFTALPEGLGMAVSARGPGACIKDDLKTALSPAVSLQGLSPHNVHGFFAGCLANALKSEIEIDEKSENQVGFAVLVTPGEEG